MMKIIRTTDPLIIDKIHALDRKIFNDGSIYVQDIPGNMFYWYIQDDETKELIAYSVAQKCRNNIVKGQRTAVIKKWRGLGIQKQFIRTKHKFFGKGITHITYVHPTNVASINSFISCGYKSYTPKSFYGGNEMLYLRRVIK